MTHGAIAYLDSSVLLASQYSDEAHHRGVRGGANYDWLHLAAARKARAEVLFILNLRDFQALARPGDPLIRIPN